MAAALLFYKNDMCVQLLLVDIYTPDDDFSAPIFLPACLAIGLAAVLPTQDRFMPTGMHNHRESLGLDPQAVTTLFTGFPTRGTLDCSYRGCHHSLSELHVFVPSVVWFLSFLLLIVGGAYDV